ncbi:hypothetical protein PD07_04805 [Escherichia coli]|nr:hypothetical protein PD07_04805 [Escherichia coli]
MTCNRALAQGDFCPLALIFCRKIGNGWKSFNTRTIGSSPASRSTFLHTTCLRFQLPPAPPLLIGLNRTAAIKTASYGH